MANQLQTQVRNPPPRMLTPSETLQTLNHWKTSFRTYYRRDSFYKGFLLPEATWDSTADSYGQAADQNGGEVIRTAADKAGDLEDFLKVKFNLKRVSNPLILCHGIVTILVLVVNVFEEDTTINHT